MKIIDDKISVTDIKRTSEEMFGNLVKAVVDVEKKIMAIGAVNFTRTKKRCCLKTVPGSKTSGGLIYILKLKARGGLSLIL